MQQRNFFSLLLKSLTPDWTQESRDYQLFVFPSAIPLPAQQKRIEVMRKRIRSLSLLLAFSVPAWSVLDAMVFPRDMWLSILEVRLLAGAAFASFLLGGTFIRWKEHGQRLVYVQLAAVFVIPTLLYLFCYKMPDSLLELEPLAKAIANSYSLLPFVILSCVGLFPLTVLESVSIVTFLLMTYFVANASTILALWTPDLGAAWVMTLLAAIAIVVSHSQLRLLMTLVGYSSYDLLTNCLGRRSGEEVIRALWHDSIRHRSHFSVVFIDLDQFKLVNDHFGHKEGDIVLASVASAIRKALRNSDFIIRWGGEEFLVIMPNAKIDDAAKVMVRMAENGFCAHPDGTHQTVSMGIAERLDDSIDDENLLIKMADARLYKAKTAGRCRVVGHETLVLAPPQPQKA